MKFVLRFLFIAIMFISNALFAQYDDDAVAKIGPKKITRSEFIERFEMTPQFRKDLKNIAPAVKLDFVYTLIAEKLWAMEAVEKGLDTTEVMRRVTASLEKMFMRDTYYRKEIKNKTVISDKEKLQGIVRYNTKLKVNFIFSTDEKEIRNLYKLLNAGVSFDTVMASGPEKDEQKEPIEITFGQMQPEIEDALYKLKQGEYTVPYSTPEGWYIFKLTDRIKAVSDKEAKEDAETTVERLIKQRKETLAYREFYNSFFKKQKVDVDAPLFNSIASKLTNIFNQRKADYKPKEGEPVFIEARDITDIEAGMGSDSLKLPFIKFEKEPLSVKDFIRQLAFDGFSVTVFDYNSVRKILSKKIGSLIEQELVTRDAYIKGYNEMPEVKRQVEMWRDNYLYQVMNNSFLDTVAVTDNDVRDYYNRLNKDEKLPMLVNIVEVLTDSLETVEKVLDEVKKGTDFKELAKKYSKREWTKKNGGEFGFFPVTAYDEIGRITGLMQVGEVYGPLKVKEGYSVFKLLEKKEQPKNEHLPFDQMKEKLKTNLAQMAARAGTIKHTVDLAYKYGIDIDPKVFNSLETTTLNTMTIRFLGFGGKITAVPLLAPNSDWVQPYFMRKNQLP